MNTLNHASTFLHLSYRLQTLWTGDVVQSFCNNALGPNCQVESVHLTTTPMQITFTHDFLNSLESDNVTITYPVTDRAGNRSILAEPVELTLRFKPN